MTEQVKLEEYSIAQLNNICGNHDENFKMIEEALEVMNSALQVMIQNILKKQKK